MSGILGLLIGVFGTFGFVVFAVLYLVVLNPEKGEIVGGWIARFFSRFSKRAEQTATALGVQGKVDSFVESVNSEAEGLLPYTLKIKWLSPDTTPEAFIKNDRVVVLLSHHKNQDSNLTRATALYMSKAVIPEARPHIDPNLSKSIDLMMTKKALFSFIEARSSLDHFITKVLRPETEENEDLKQFCQSIELTDERGLFTRILLRELLELGRRRAGVTETGDTIFESNEFVKILKAIAEKEKGQDVDPIFLKKYIRAAVILIARPEKMASQGMKPYINAVKKYGINKSARTIYVFARGKNVSFAKSVVDSCDKKFSEITIIHEEEFSTKLDGDIIPAYCAIFYNRKAA